MINSKTSLNHERNDIMTSSHFVPAEQLEHSKPVFEQYDPLIAAYDFRWNKLFTKPLSQIEGMAYGVREDLLTGKWMPGAIIGNQCPAISSTRVCFWVFVD
jgi:hypothetical protein